MIRRIVRPAALAGDELGSDLRSTMLRSLRRSRHEPFTGSAEESTPKEGKVVIIASWFSIASSAALIICLVVALIGSLYLLLTGR